MNERLCRPLELGRRAQATTAARCMTADDARGRQGFRPLSRRRRRRHPVPHLPGTHPTKGSFFTRGTSRDRYARYTEEGARLRRQHAAAAAQVRDREEPRAARRCAGDAEQADAIRRDLFRLDLARDGRGDRHARGATACHLDMLRVRGFPFHRRRRRLHRATTTSCSWSSRTATRSCAR